MNDLLFALRRLRKTPAFTLFAILTLGLGIGASTAMFSVVDGILLRPLALREPDRLVRVQESYLDRPGWLGSVSAPNFRDWVERSRSFEGLALSQGASFALTGGEAPERLRGAVVSANYFGVAGSAPIFGRAFQPNEERAGENQVAVISEELWRARFKADPAVVGTRITLDGIGVTIVGIMPARFRLPSERMQIWRPLVLSEAAQSQRGMHMFDAIGRLRPGVTLAAARTELAGIAADLAKQFPEAQANRTVALTPMIESLTGRARSGLVLLSAGAVSVLLIAAANVAGLLLARAASQRREIAIRTALGAAGWHILRRLLAESVLLAAGAAAVGIFLAHWGVDAFLALAGDSLPRAQEVQVNFTALSFAVLAAALAGVGCGLIPALAVLRGEDPLSGLQSRGTAGGSGRSRLRSVLVISEIALALVLLSGGGLLFRSLSRLLDTPAGLRPENVLTARIALPPERYPTAASLAELYGRLETRLRSAPGVEAAGGISILPIDDWGSNGDFTIEGRPPFPQGSEPQAEKRAVFGAYYRALGIGLVAGRFLDERDGPEAPRTIVINETMAKRFWGSASAALGARLTGINDNNVAEVVGVFADVRQSGLDRAPELEAHFSAAQSAHTGAPGESWAQTMSLVLKPAPGLDYRAAVAPLREAVRTVDAGLPLYRVLPMSTIIDEFAATRKLNLRLLGCFAGVALVLAAVGLYGVMSYLVTQREREFGVRLALGANGSDLLRLVLRQGLTLGAIGGGIGLLSALGLGRLLESMLYGVSAWDPLVLVSVLAVLGLVVLAATVLPARRAERVDPIIALRAE